MAPQPGPQEAFCSSSADVVIFGGAAGGGKTVGLLIEPLRHMSVEGFRAVFFRRTYPRIMAAGAMWDESENLYTGLATPVKGDAYWRFPSGARFEFSHMQREADRFEWKGAQIPYVGIDQLEEFCLHPETEVLTEDGWAGITEVEPGERVASLNEDKETVFAPVQRVWSTPCTSGQLVDVFQESGGVSFRATSGHRWPVQTQRSDGSWAFKRTEDLKHDRILRSGEYRGGVEVDEYNLEPVSGRGLGKNANSVESVPMDNWLRFLGWWFAEGGTYVQRRGSESNTPQVNLCQTGAGKPEVRDALEALGFRYHEQDSGMFTICSRQLYDELNTLGDTYTKRIPRWVFRLPVRQMRIFWDAFVAGDGHITETGAVTIGLANEGLIDDLQEMAFLLGLIATKGESTVHVKGGEYTVHRLSVSKPDRNGWSYVDRGNFTKEAYNGDVWCLVVPGTETFLIRHRGRICWSGNTEKQFWYLRSRNRSTCGVAPYLRATCNPVPEDDETGGWLRGLVDWWIGDDGFPIEERAGAVRWFVRPEDDLEWSSDPEELRERHPSHPVQSLTFIPSTLEDNPLLERADPEYRGKLMAMPKVERERLLHGNWNVRPGAGEYFRRGWFRVVGASPSGGTVVRAWDLAASREKKGADPAWTAGVRVRKLGDGKETRFVVEDLVRLRGSPHEVERLIANTATQDGRDVIVRLPQDPGQAGKAQISHYAGLLAGHDLSWKPVTGSKVTRAGPASSQAEAGNVDVVRGDWNEAFFRELERFPDGAYSDVTDALSDAIDELTPDATKKKKTKVRWRSA